MQIRSNDFILGDPSASKDAATTDAVGLCTVRLDCALVGGRSRKGTGFFHSFGLADGSTHTIIVTNRHVVDGANAASFHVCAGDHQQQPVSGKHHCIPIEDLPRYVTPHPEGLDLCAIDISGMTSFASSEGLTLCYRAINDDFHLSDYHIALTSAVEDVIVVGYPVGLWDSVNNRPVIRRGITATPLSVDFCGRPEFLIDAASFEGSSGSPVFLFQSHLAQAEADVLEVLSTPRVRLVGILVEGEYHSKGAELIDVFPTSETGARASVDIPIHIGHVLKASALEGLRTVIRSNVSASSN
jgi:hypothetical protein